MFWASFWVRPVSASAPFSRIALLPAPRYARGPGLHLGSPFPDGIIGRGSGLRLSPHLPYAVMLVGQALEAVGLRVGPSWTGTQGRRMSATE